jgi:hypothetical protein
MAVQLQSTVGVKINSVDISDHVSSATLSQIFDELEITSLGDFSHRYVKGLEASQLSLDFFNDFAASQVTPTLQAAYGTTVTAVLIPVKGTAVSASNPLFTVSILVNNLTPIAGDVASINASSISFTCNSTVVQTTTGTF